MELTLSDLKSSTRTGINALARYRSFMAKSLEAANVDVEKRVIYGYAVITRGEALGHREWIDSEALDQVVALGNAADKGVKCRFTHPDLCSDGLGKYLGRARKFRRDGDVVRADLHLSPVTRKAPEMANDPGEYILAMAQTEPDMFGTSIVFRRDIRAEDRFIADHTDADGVFTSPDPDNENNYYHLRLAELFASDIVDEPAANPGGFFSAGEERAAAASTALAYLLGLDDQTPDPSLFGQIGPERSREFVLSFLQRRALHVAPISPHGKDIAMSEKKEDAGALAPAAVEDETPAEPESDAAETPVDETPSLEGDDVRAQFAALRAAFPADHDFVAESFEKGLSVEQAKAQYADVLAARVAALESEKAELAEKLAKAELEMSQFKAELLDGAEEKAHTPEPKNLTESELITRADEYQETHQCSFEAAYKAVKKELEQ